MSVDGRLPPRSNNKLHYSFPIFLTHIRPHLPRTWNTVLLAKNNTRALFFLHNSPVIFGIITDRKRKKNVRGSPPTALRIMISSPQLLQILPGLAHHSDPPLYGPSVRISGTDVRC
ncbi:hypothetical protein CEXT_131991 [Caerostris extrusa]|uniref:Uncharacterized protein n=1 Tax=Caerostris extrusa TaxID=172846 RepID=A0AAV4Y347_CAEEX|nr:hypothetical protein CEXT_131991 [Caerostris extrusa]